MKRRDFLLKSGCALGMTALASQLERLGLATALAQKAKIAAVPTDYRALVCISLMGGNDGNNTVVPIHNDANVSGYSHYAAARGTQGLALPQNDFLPMNVPRIGGLSYGLHPAFGTIAGQTNNGVYELYGQGKMAIVTNVGTLIQPLTRQQYQSGSAARPFQLFSHTDQTNQQQSARSDTPVLSGWGGRLSDKITDSANPAHLIPTVAAIAGSQLFGIGENTQPVNIGPAPTPLNRVLAFIGNDGSPAANARLNALAQSFEMDADSELVAASNRFHKQALEISRSLENTQDVTVAFPNTGIGNQLKQIARLIKNRAVLGVNRQIFACTLEGFDTHSGQLGAQTILFSQLSQAMRAFYDEMTVQNLQNNVTQFTLSDFSRTFNPGGAGSNVGSDHAWANHMFVLGGAVLGGNFYGMNTTNGTPFPSLVQNGPDDADAGGGARGRWIPTTSVDQYAATLTNWFGLPAADTNYVFPNLRNFTTANLEFMMP